MEQYIVTGMSCAACQARVEKAVEKVPGVSSVSVSLLTNSMGVEGTASEAEIIRAVEAAGYGASLKGAAAESRGADALKAEEDALKDRETPVLKRRLLLSVGFLLVLMYITMGHHMAGFPLPAFLVHNHLALTLTQMLLALTVMIINGKFFTSGFKSLLHGAPNMDTLVALGSSVSFGWSLFVFYRMCGMIASGASNADLMDLYQGRQQPLAMSVVVDSAGLPHLKSLMDGKGATKSVEDLRELKEYCGLPFIVKGIMTVNGARKAVEAGADAIIVSNHGGRVLSDTPATADVLMEIADAVKGQTVIMVDGGIRSGLDVFKALAMGADFCLICRPVLISYYGGGQEGIACYLDKIRSELEDTMYMCGVHSIGEINRSNIRF